MKPLHLDHPCERGLFTDGEIDQESGLLVCLVRWDPACRTPLDCGSSCVLAIGHNGVCECAGDDPGQPGACPA